MDLIDVGKVIRSSEAIEMDTKNTRTEKKLLESFFSVLVTKKFLLDF